MTSPRDFRSVPGATGFACEKAPATGARGMVVTNHPLASAAGMEALAAGGNAYDAAVTALFTLSVVEPMMVGIFGGGTAVIRTADGRETVVDGLSTAPAACKPDTYTPVSDAWPDYMETKGRENSVGFRAVAVPGNLQAWCEILAEFGTQSLATAMQAAIRHAEHGFAVTPYLSACIEEKAADLALNPDIAALLLPGGTPLPAGARLVQKDYAATLKLIAAEGPDVLYTGALGRTIGAAFAAAGGYLSADDLARYKTERRDPVRGSYRGIDLIGPPPPASGGVQVIQMLNLMEHFDIAGSGFGTPATLHLVLEALKIAGADRTAATADPAFVDVPVARLTSKAYAAERLHDIDPARAQPQAAKALGGESANTTHVTVADGDGNVIAATQTINSLFGAAVILPGTGIIANNYMYLFDPHPRHTLSLMPGKRITSSMSGTIALKDGRPLFAMGQPGGRRIPAGVFQAILNLVDHGMSLQEAVEAPRVYTQGQEVELEPGFPAAVHDGLAALGHDVREMPHVGGGMAAVRFGAGGMEGASCWRADGTPIGIGGGLARAGARFWPDQAKADAKPSR